MAIDGAERAAVADAITRLERELYGRGPSGVQVSCSHSEPEILTVLSMDTLTVADRVLVDRGHVQAVIAHHNALFLATWDDFYDEVTTIVGEPPHAYFAQVDPQTGYAIRVFVFQRADAAPPLPR